MLYANTDDGSSALWVCDENGVVVDNISYSIGDRAPILEQINEHYGTSFTGWSDNEIGLRLGDTVPNWNAYEKIEMQIPYYAVTTGGENTFAAGYMDGNVWHVYFYANNNALRINNTGLITGELAYADSLIQGLLLPKMRNNGIEVQSYVQEVIDWDVGETIPNVGQYTFITS